MAFHFAKLTLSNGKPVYVNCDLVAAVYDFELNSDCALVEFAGDDDNYVRVKESVETTMDIICDAMQE